jgi:hypothetical protein
MNIRPMQDRDAAEVVRERIGRRHGGWRDVVLLERRGAVV